MKSGFDYRAEPLILYEVSGDGGVSWTKQWLTPSDLTRHLCDGYLVRGC